MKQLDQIREREQGAANAIDDLNSSTARWMSRVGASQADVNPLISAIDAVLLACEVNDHQAARWLRDRAKNIREGA